MFSAKGKTDLQRRSFLGPPPTAHDRRAAFDKVEGMLLGLAVGDALGNASESLTPGQRQRMHGEIADYLVHRHANERRGLPADDSQLASWTLEQLLSDDGLVPENLARRFAGGRIFGIGATVSVFLANAQRCRLDRLPRRFCQDRDYLEIEVWGGPPARLEAKDGSASRPTI